MVRLSQLKEMEMEIPHKIPNDAISQNDTTMRDVMTSLEGDVETSSCECRIWVMFRVQDD